MGKDELQATRDLVSTINSLDQNKFYIIAVLAVIVGIGYLIKWYVTQKSQQKTDNLLTSLTNSITSFSRVLDKHESASGVRMERLTTVMEEIRDRQKNIIGKTDSIRIIINKFNDVVKREIIGIFEWSLINNDYKARKPFVKRKIKTALADHIMMAKKSLSEFNLSVDLEQFFITYKNQEDQNVHLKLVDLLWDEVEPIYERVNPSGEEEHKIFVDQQLEEMQIAVNNVITAELTKIQLEVNNLYR